MPAKKKSPDQNGLCSDQSTSFTTPRRSPATKRLKKGEAESDIQKAIVKFLTLALPEGAEFFHVPNTQILDRKKNFFGMLKKLEFMGFRPGVSDLIIYWKKTLVCMEVKGPRGVASPKQKEWLEKMRGQGAHTCIVRSVDDAEHALKTIMPLRAKSTDKLSLGHRRKNDMTYERLVERLHYDPETGVFTWKQKTTGRIKPNREAGWVTSNGYRYIEIDGKGHAAHRLAFLYMTGKLPETHEDVDHINMDPGDNRFENLRIATRGQNIVNSKRHKNNTSGYKGVSFDPGRQKWMAQCRGKTLGLFDTPEAAYKKYLEVAKKEFGEFLRAS